ncbi:hypothetical protein SDC9_62018 [bioreactor metagenome]|jgi:DNA helicase II / ATP-dependent DNA helicase PcrA|uniref:UvrD-like helicase ATP-binding domain-containing protein n=1 Tax=bioreactor metagenome TaxID=1076179 RepID=A0A644XI78_9ZZZZ
MLSQFLHIIVKLLLKIRKILYNISNKIIYYVRGIRVDKKEKLIEEESKILEYKLKLIRNKIIKNDRAIKNYSVQDINIYKEVDESQRKKIIKEQNDLKEVVDNLYFGKLVIEYKEDDQTEIAYIGRKGINIDNESIVYSWAAPIANIYEEYNGGEYKRKYIDKGSGKELFLQGNIKDKRKIKIEKSKVIDVYSYASITEKDEEEFIKDKIEKSSTEKLGVILETVQSDQNKIIRLPIEKNILVQGCAGSGKSSVAFHRLAYLAYNYSLKDNELLVISPNKIFQGYTSNILIELGTDFNVRQNTFKEFAEITLNKKIQNTVINYDENSEEGILKTSKRFKLILDNYINYLEENFIPKDNVIIDNFELINSSEILSIRNKLFSTYKINDRVEKIQIYIEKYLKEKMQGFINSIEKLYKVNMDVFSKYNRSAVIYNETLKLSKEEQEIRIKRFKKQCLAIISGYISNFKKVEAIEKYQELLGDRNLLDKLSKGILNRNEIDIIAKDEIEGLINNIDCIPILYLHNKINENKNKYRHIVIDECQDLSYLEIAVIEGLTQSFTLVGDFNQRININKSTISLNEISEMFKKYIFFESYYLNKSFRNSMSITNYANAILQGYFINKESIPIAFNRETSKPKVYLNMKKEQTIKAVVESIKGKNSTDKNIAVILKTELETIDFYNQLSTLLKDKKVNLIDNEYCNYEKGINVLSAKLSKGLEFDYVILVDANEYKDNENDKRLLYIATTRALHGLEIYTEDKECFITNIDNNLWESKFKLSTTSMNQPIRDAIIKTLMDGFGNLPKEYINYINSIDNYAELTEFGAKLDGLEDIHKLFNVNLKKRETLEIKETMNEASVTLERQVKIGYLEKLTNEIKNNNQFFTGKQSDVFEYIKSNIEYLSKFKNCKELADNLGVSTATINTVLMKLNLGSFGSFISKINRCIKNDLKSRV